MVDFPRTECTWRGGFREEAQVCADQWARETGEPYHVKPDSVLVDECPEPVYYVTGNDEFDCGVGKVYDSWFLGNNEAHASECARMLNLIAKSQGRSERYFYALFSNNVLTQDSYIVLEEPPAK